MDAILENGTHGTKKLIIKRVILKAEKNYEFKKVSDTHQNHFCFRNNYFCLAIGTGGHSSKAFDLPPGLTEEEATEKCLFECESRNLNPGDHLIFLGVRSTTPSLKLLKS